MRKRTKIIGGGVLGLAVLGVIGQATGAGADLSLYDPAGCGEHLHDCPGCPAAPAPSSTPAPEETTPEATPEATTPAPAPKATTPAPKPKPAPVVPDYTASQEQAIGKAEDYLGSMHFSRSGLIEQLEFEDFTKADATFAVAHVEVDWNEQAAGKAQDYLDSQHFSRSGLIEQLAVRGLHQGPGHLRRQPRRPLDPPLGVTHLCFGGRGGRRRAEGSLARFTEGTTMPRYTLAAHGERVTGLTDAQVAHATAYPAEHRDHPGRHPGEGHPDRLEERRSWAPPHRAGGAGDLLPAVLDHRRHLGPRSDLRLGLTEGTTAMTLDEAARVLKVANGKTRGAAAQHIRNFRSAAPELFSANPQRTIGELVRAGFLIPRKSHAMTLTEDGRNLIAYADQLGAT